jgi:ribonucleoside-diphosphate reductase alpha chain
LGFFKHHQAISLNKAGIAVCCDILICEVSIAVLEELNMAAHRDVRYRNKIRDKTLWQRYLRKDKNGKVIETEDKMNHRVARVIAAVERLYGATLEKIRTLRDRFYQMMKRGEFMPNSPTLMNAGRKNGMLGACFVLPVPDSVDGIFDAIKSTALIQKAGGGTGFDFSQLRPTGDIVASSGGKTSGPISFLQVFAEATNAIQQGAFRRGANMGMMSIDHPDILKFIHAKQDPNAFTNLNISVKVTDAFMNTLDRNPDAIHIVVNPRTKRRYAIPRSVDIGTYTIDDLVSVDQAADDCYTVKEVWNMIIRNAHATGEPGICFIDRVNADNPTPHLGRIEASNPCGEQPLLPFESCNLGSINVLKFVNVTGDDLDWDSLASTVKLAVRFLDNVIDANHFPIPQIEKITHGNRKIGLGIMGFADTLVLLGIRYDSEAAKQFAEKLASFIQEHAHKASEELAKERGCFPNWRGSIWDTKHHRPMRNATVTTIAPTGTISLLSGCNGGIEPVFSIVTKRRALDGREFLRLNPLVEKIGSDEGWLSGKVRNQLMKGIPPREIPEIPRELAEVLVTAHEISPEWHVRIQAAFQRYVDNAVSKTTNLPADATVKDVDHAYRFAHKLGSKGITVYRDQSRDNQVITTARQRLRPVTEVPQLKPRTRTTTGKTTKFRMGCGTLFVTVNRDEHGLCEVFANLGKSGCPAQSEATCRAVSIALRCGIKPDVLTEQLKGIRCLSAISGRKGNKDIDVLSCPDAIARAIEEAMGENPEPAATGRAKECPECRQPMRRESGCDVCDNCAYRKCG